MSSNRTRAERSVEAGQYDPSSGLYSILRCEECDAVALTISADAALACHGRPMTPVQDYDLSVQPPDLRQVLLDVFDLPKAGLDICLCVIGDGPLSASEVAATLAYDRSTVTRYLNKLVELGLLRRTELNGEAGGVVNVYHSVDLERMRRKTLVGVYAWAGRAAALIEDANLTKQDRLAENPDQRLPEIFWEAFADR
jgi:predicted transcriptional regulator